MPTRQQLLTSKDQRERQVATCCLCHEEKPWTEFEPSKNRRPFGLASSCNPCNLKRKGVVANKWRQKQDPDFIKILDRKKSLSRFNLTIEEYDLMFEKQKGLCAICFNPEDAVHHSTGQVQRLTIDHCHSSNRVRKLLCARCNKGLGMFVDDITRLQNAIKYLQENNNGS